MKTKLLILAALAAFTTSSAHADILIDIDLTVENQVTVRATSGLSAETISNNGSLWIHEFFDVDGTTIFNQTLVGTADFTSAANTPDGSPQMSRGGSSTGISISSWTSDESNDFTAGTTAFTGSATWSLSSVQYSEMLAGANGGDLLFPVDASPTPVLGQYNVIKAVPEPCSFSLIACFGIGFLLRRSRV